MDLVYQLSHHPVALLGHPMETGSEIDLLALILTGTFVISGTYHKLSEDVTDTSSSSIPNPGIVKSSQRSAREAEFKEQYGDGFKLTTAETCSQPE